MVVKIWWGKLKEIDGIRQEIRLPY